MTILFTFSAFGVDVESVPGQSIVDSILSFISSGSGAMIIAAVLEFVLRFVKSDKPMSIMYVIAGAFKLFGNLLSKLGEFLDKVLPQKVK